MSSREHTRPPRPFAGLTERPLPIITIFAQHPFDATVTVTPLRLQGYEDIQFEIAASWVGPALSGTPTATGPVRATDTYMVTDLDLAKHVAERAQRTLVRGEIPDLRVLAEQVRSARHM
jgi:hypothetical protein